MSKRTETAITKVDAQFLTKYVDTDESLQGLEEFFILPSLKIIQAMTADKLKDKFSEGSVIVHPGSVLLHSVGEPPFDLIPIHFFVQWLKWSHIDDTENPAVVDTSFDPASKIAKRARDKDKRTEPYEGGSKLFFRYVEHFRFACLVDSGPLLGQQVILSFERGEWYNGKNFISACKMRRTTVAMEDGSNVSVPVPLWAQRWSFSTSKRTNGTKKWFGFDFAPAEEALIDGDRSESLKLMFEELRDAHKANMIVVEEEHVGTDEATESNEF